ncbi:MAG: relaxase, partial [Pseudoramibacter sp. EUB1.1]|nr:relaxase [Candidatus Pseudoramibacter fermentans]
WERGKNLTYQLLGTNYKSRGTKLGLDYEKETIFNELASRQTQSRINQQPKRAINATTDPTQSDPDRTPELPGHSDSTTINSQNVPRSTASSDRTDRPTSQPRVSDDLKQLRQQQRQLAGPIKTDLTKRLRSVPKADQPDQSAKPDRPQTDSNRARPKQPAPQPTQRPSEPDHSRDDGPSR